MQNDLLSAKEAASELGISLPTLYAYVSRGQLRSEEVTGSREKRYRRDDVRRLVERKELRRDPSKVAAGALHWGTPLLDSAITHIAPEGIFYRGENAVKLAREQSFETVASLLWRGTLEASDLFTPRSNTPRKLPAHDDPIVRAQLALAVAGAADHSAFDLRPTAIPPAAARIVRLLARAMSDGNDSDEPIATHLARSWELREKKAARLIDAALILCADHELNISSFTARCIASARSTPYAVVSGALSALVGIRHGGQTGRVESLFDELSTSRDIFGAMTRRLQRGEEIPGFGHPLYRDGDPRAIAMMEMLGEINARKSDRDFVDAVAAAGHRLLGEHPTVDFALVAVARLLRLPVGTPLVLFSIGRSAGWLAHAIEQYGDAETIRPRARYVGKAPV